MHNTVYIRLLLIFFSVSLFFSSNAQNNQRSCRIKTIVGSVKIRRGSTVNWLDARVNMPVKERDAVRTFIESELELVTSEGTIIKVGENSTIELDKLNQKENKDNTKVKIMNGNLTANVKKLLNSQSNFEFETPTATAAIRGTVVGFEVNKEKTVVKVFEGKVLVTPRGSRNSSELKENQMASVVKGQKSITIEKLTEKSSMIQPLPDSTTKVAATDSTVTDTSKQTQEVAIVSQPAVDLVLQNSIPADSSLSVSQAASSDSSRITTQVSPKDTLFPLLATREDMDTIITGKGSDTVKMVTETKSTGTVPIKIAVTSPAEGTVVKPLTALSISGSVFPVQTTILINGKSVPVGSGGTFKTNFNAPALDGSFEIVITGDYGSSSQTISRSVTVKQTELRFEISSPADGQIVRKTIIPVSGTVTPGAELTVMSIKMPVASNGTFSGQIPIPNEVGELHLEFEASYDGNFRNISRKIIFEPEYRFTLVLPQDGQEVTSTTILIRGEVLPTTARVSVLGRSLTVSTTGLFSGTINIPDEEGKVELDFEISSGTLAKTENRSVIYKKPRDISRPEIRASLPLLSETGKIAVPVFDRTVDDEITFWYEIDGDKDSEKGPPNSSFSLTLLPGLHKYTIYATDKAGNQSSVISQNIIWFGTTDWIIKPVKLSEILHLPPSGPGGDYQPIYTVEFSVENLPDNDMKLIGAVTVTNKTTGENVTKKMFTSNTFSFDIKLKNHATNVIEILVEDIRKSVKMKTINVYIK